jgi:hypothetical protein
MKTLTLTALAVLLAAATGCAFESTPQKRDDGSVGQSSALAAGTADAPAGSNPAGHAGDVRAVAAPGAGDHDESKGPSPDPWVGALGTDPNGPSPDPWAPDTHVRTAPAQ